MIKLHKNRRNKGDDHSQDVTYEEIMEIINHRHDTERFGDNDIM